LKEGICKLVREKPVLDEPGLKLKQDKWRSFHFSGGITTHEIHEEKNKKRRK